ncbi:hypothetical protein LTR64_002589 [Lithohypha guttulata]|uniref:uncharacterized protein n=1 Tax=Lithohypha guttulata TaxID=1690604 RepID=UPI002DE0E16A|nr:hypothetical protein LTR51_001186 [Lithohypha guttulata]
MSSHRSRTTETQAKSFRTTSTGPPSLMSDNIALKNHELSTTTSSKRVSGISRTTSRKRPDATSDSNPRSMSSKPSTLPRPVSSSAQALSSSFASSRLTPAYAGRSPPLQALNLGPSTISYPRLDTSRAITHESSMRGHNTQTFSPLEYDDDTVFGIAVPEKAGTYPPARLPPRLIPELQALAASSSRPVNPASSSIGSISSPSTCPSTQFTTSSSPWSASTTTTTPISWSSASPHVVNPSSASSKRSDIVPVPQSVKTRVPRLPMVKETQPPAPSSKVMLTNQGERSGRKLKRSTPVTPEPTPPPRSSSLKTARSRSNSATTSRSGLQETLASHLTYLPGLAITSDIPLPAATDNTERLDAESADLGRGHLRLQAVLNTAPHQEPRAQATDPPREITQATCHDPARSRQLLEPLPIAQNQHRRIPSLSRRRDRRPSNSENESEVEKLGARGRLAKFSKLALFGRSKEKAETDSQAQNPQPRKGPRAGTGHEGYGRFGRRIRKQSSGSDIGGTESETSVTSNARNPVQKRQSRTSSASQDQSDLDDFAATRMKPIAMKGGSQRGRTNPFPVFPKNPQLSDVSLSTMSSSDTYMAYTRASSPRRERFPPATEEVRQTLATRRSQKFALSEESFRMPEPIETSGLAATPALDSRNTTRSSELLTPASAMYRIDPVLLDKQKGRSKKLKWNIFRRKDSISEGNQRPIERPQKRPGMSVDVAAAPAHRPVPYYAMLGSESEVVTTTTIGQFLREAQESPERDDEVISVGLTDDEILGTPNIRPESVLLPMALSKQARPGAPKLTEVPQALSPEMLYLQKDHVSEPHPVRRQPRLAQVGRIPKVVPTRQQAQPGVAASEAFTVPFERQSRPITVKSKPSRDRLPRLTTQIPPVTISRPPKISRLDDEVTEPSVVKRSEAQDMDSDFLKYQSMRDSDFTTSTESTGIISIMGPPASQLSSFDAQAEQLLHDDDVWHEYNDFMDDIMSPTQQTKSPSSTQKKGDRTLRISGRDRVVSKGDIVPKGLAILPPRMPAAQTSKGSLLTPPLPLSSGASLQEMPSSDEIRLRRSRIAAALHTSSYAPSSPFSMRDFLDEYGRPSSGKFSDHLSESSALASVQPQRDHSRVRQYENAAHLEEIERTHNPTKHSDRQYASLMVSRWLSFGRVLFSPAHLELETNSQRHVLVIDGLGNEDWSIYCAVTYQAQEVFVHDLKERRIGKSRGKTAQSSEGAPPNHRRSELSSFNEKFPLPPAFFTAIVVRFPPAMPDSKLKNIVSECRRALARGGYLELMVLDLDIVNMGSQTRKAIKDLKIKMTAADRTVSLKPIIDNVQHVLGSNGFSNLNRCIVGVPVVGKPAGSLDSSSESRSSSGSGAGPGRRLSAGPRPYGNLGGQANFSLNDLVADHSDNADAKIGRMVSKTARSWWQHCFEAGIITESNTSKSVFASKEVIKECKARAASFKLLIAYSQKPPVRVEERRRTMSEPTIPKLATAGSTKAPR